MKRNRPAVTHDEVTKVKKVHVNVCGLNLTSHFISVRFKNIDGSVCRVSAAHPATRFMFCKHEGN